MKRTLHALVFFLLAVVAWDLACRARIWSPVLVPSPGSVARYLWSALLDGTLLSAIGVTMKRLLLGYLFGIALGLPLGLLTARFKVLNDTLGLMALGLQTLPSVCWVPLALLWFGQTESAMFFVVVMGTLWSVIIATDNGVRNVPPIYARAARTMGSGELHTWLHVMLPASLPWPKIYNDITETIGNTPLVRLNRTAKKHGARRRAAQTRILQPALQRQGPHRLRDDRRRAEVRRINKDTVLIEPTSGNTGIALAFVAAAKGLKLILTMPETMSLERRKLLKILGARLVLTEGAEGHEGRHRQGRGTATSRFPTASFSSSFPIRPTRRSTARPPPRKSGATPTARWTSSSPASAPAAPSPAWARCSSRASRRSRSSRSSPTPRRCFPAAQPGPHKLQGIGAGFIPAVLNTKIYDEVIRVKETDSGPVSKQVNQLDGIPDRHLLRRGGLGGAAAGQAPGEQGQADRRDHPVEQRALPLHVALRRRQRRERRRIEADGASARVGGAGRQPVAPRAGEEGVKPAQKDEPADEEGFVVPVAPVDHERMDAAVDYRVIAHDRKPSVSRVLLRIRNFVSSAPPAASCNHASKLAAVTGGRLLNRSRRRPGASLVSPDGQTTYRRKSIWPVARVETRARAGFSFLCRPT
jgi:hypothetical protein